MLAINRLLSRGPTTLFLYAGTSPNAITLVAGAIGLVAAGLLAIGWPAGGMLGALLFQVYAVLDNCDGEVARATGRTSPMGAWLDTIVDGVVHVALFSGLALAAAAQRVSGWMVVLAWLAPACSAGAFLLIGWQKRQGYGLSAPNRSGPAGEAASWPWRLVGELVDGGDFGLVVLLAVGLGWLPLLAALCGAGAVCFLALVLGWEVAWRVSGTGQKEVGV